MKAIFTTYKHGVCRATDGDGNSYQESSFEHSRDNPHVAALVGLCIKMDWTGTLVSAHLCKAGKQQGMVWVWDSPTAMRCTVGSNDGRPKIVDVAPA
jgi:hypothetical protein